MPPAAALALTPETDITGAFAGARDARGLGVASGGRAGAFEPCELAGEDARQAASTADRVVGANPTTGAIGIRKPRKPPARRPSRFVRIAGSPIGATGAANGVALTGPAEASLASTGSSTGVISVVSTNGVAASTGPSAAETAPSVVSMGGTLTGEGGTGTPCTGAATGIVMPPPTLTCVTEPSFPGLAIRIAILVLICGYPVGVSE